MPKKIFIIAGEPSGDLHGKNLVKAILKHDPQVIIQAYGGKNMEEAGAKIVRNYENYAFMGFLEVARNLKTVLSNIKVTQKLIIEFNPDVIIFIDFPGFNLRVASALKEKLPSTKFYYYIAPQVWAWKSKRVHKLDKLMDKIFVILPFEKAFFARYNYEVDYVGHPLIDELKNRKKTSKEEKLIAILPGSRKQEIQKMLPVFSKVAALLPDYDFEISKMEHISEDFYHSFMSTGKNKNIRISKRQTYDLIQAAEGAVVTSGTATLETALLGTPLICAYKTSKVSYWIAKRLVNVKYISLVNLILNKSAIPELIQNDVNIKRLKMEISDLFNPIKKQEMLNHFKELRSVLGSQSSSDIVSKKI